MIKARVESSGELTGWLDSHDRIGFLAEHKRHIDQLNHDSSSQSVIREGSRCKKTQ